MRISHQKSGVPATNSLPKCVSMVMYRERECHEADSNVEVPLRVLYRVSRHPEAPCEANLSSLKEIEKPAGIKNPARLKACRAAILPTGSVMRGRYGVACCAASSISAATSLGCDS